MTLHPRPASPRRRAARPRGVAMVIVLMFLLAITGIAVFSARYALFGEGMARNQLDYEVARQAAEAALRDAERDLRMASGSTRPGAPCTRNRVPDEPLYKSVFMFDGKCTQGQCGLDKESYANRQWDEGNAKNDKAEPWWPTATGGLWNDDFRNKPGNGGGCEFAGAVPLGTYTGVARIAGVAHQPEYLIEFLKTDANKSSLFRISARGFGYSENTQVLLQSYFVPPEDS